MAAIVTTEIDYYKFTATSSGAHVVSTATPGSPLDTVVGVFSSSGQRLAFNDDISRTDTDSRLSVNLTAGAMYYVGITNYSVRSRGTYNWAIDGPASVPTAPDDPVVAFPDVPNYGGTREWNLNSINAPESWAQGYEGQGVVVAVIDTGVDLDHSDLVSRIWINQDEIAGNGIDDDQNGQIDDVSGWDFVSGDNNPDDGNGHGTHVAGTIAADDNGVGATGVAPDATIMPIRVLDNNGSGTAASVASGIRYAAANGADIINLSLGGSFSSVIQAAIQYAQQLDVLVVVAAGNESASNPSYPARLSATLSNVLSVGAHNLSSALASFSNDVGRSGAVQVDAPGVSVYSTYIGGSYATFSGTSMATPHVAGLAALALSANASLSASQLRTLIVEGATRVVSGSDSQGGINAAVTVAIAEAGQTATSAIESLAQPVNNYLSSSHPLGFYRMASVSPGISAGDDTSASSALQIPNSGTNERRYGEANDQALLALLAPDDLAPRCSHTDSEARPLSTEATDDSEPNEREWSSLSLPGDVLAASEESEA